MTRERTKDLYVSLTPRDAADRARPIPLEVIDAFCLRILEIRGVLSVERSAAPIEGRHTVFFAAHSRSDRTDRFKRALDVRARALGLRIQLSFWEGEAVWTSSGGPVISFGFGPWPAGGRTKQEPE